MTHYTSRREPERAASSEPGSLAATKLMVPARPEGTIARQRLLRSVAAGVDGSVLTLVVGPAGSGKTVLLSSWADHAAVPVAWLALDPSDAKPQRFWDGVLRALRHAGVSELSGVRAGDRRDGESVVSDIVNALVVRADPVVLVLDDFHEVAASVAQGLGRLLEHAPRALRVVILTRRDPVLRLGRLRLAGGVRDLRAGDLACTLEETHALLREAGVRLPRAVVERVWQRTEGWAAAVRLAVLSLRGADDPERLVEQFTGEDTVVSEYLFGEVLRRLSDETLDFLLRTSIVDVLDGHLADALTGRARGHETLVELARGGLLISAVDRQARWFRYHGLFAELLRAELRWRDPALVPRLHAVAAEWFSDGGDDVRAVGHAVAGEAWELAAHLAASRWLDLLLRGELDVLAPLADAVPHAAVDRDPGLALAIAALRVDGAPLDRARAAVVRASAAVAATRPADPRLEAERSVVELLLSRRSGDRERALESARAALEHPDHDGSIAEPALRSLVLTNAGMAEAWTGRPVEGRSMIRRGLAAAREADSAWLTFLAVAHLAGAESGSGDLPTARRRADEAIRLAQEHGWTRTTAAGAAFLVAAQIAADQSRFEDAGALIERADVALEHARDRPLRAALAVPRVTVLSALDRPGEGLDVLNAVVEELGAWPIGPGLRASLTSWEARLLAVMGRREEAFAVLREATVPDALPVLAALARLQVADGDFAGARVTLAPALAHGASASGSTIVDAWLADAMALDGLLEHEAAAAALERALAIAEPAAMLRPIVANGGALLPLLHRQERIGTAHPLLLRRAVAMIEQRAPATRTGAGLTEPLSERELQVLRYAPTTMTNQDIAGELFLSVNTVKTHLRSIYRKLDACGRRDAVVRARRLRILGPA